MCTHQVNGIGPRSLVLDYLASRKSSARFIISDNIQRQKGISQEQAQYHHLSLELPFHPSQLQGIKQAAQKIIWNRMRILLQLELPLA